jgi:hypothetical protein
MVGFDKGNSHTARIRDNSGNIHRQRVNPFSIDSQHMDDQVSCALRTVDGPSLPVGREVCIMIRMSMSAIWLSAIADQISKNDARQKVCSDTGYSTITERIYSNRHPL